MDLIEEVDSFVPDHLKPETLLYLRATAGLRLLGEDIAQKLLQAVQEKFKRTKYRVEPDAAGLLSGADEGIFAWFSVNYFKGMIVQEFHAASFSVMKYTISDRLH